MEIQIKKSPTIKKPIIKLPILNLNWRGIMIGTKIQKKFKDYLNTTPAQKINDIVLDAYNQRLHETEIDLLIGLLTKVKNKEVKDAGELMEIIEKFYFNHFTILNIEYGRLIYEMQRT